MNKEKAGETKYFRVCAPMGHLGAKRSREITFYIQAKDITSAIRHAMDMPGVKHNKCVFMAREINREEYLNGRCVSAYHRQ